MKVAIVLVVAVLAVAFAKPVDQRSPLPFIGIVKSTLDQNPNGAYTFGLETENNIRRDEVGELKIVKDAEGKDLEVLVVRGSHSYVDPEGKTITTNYFADETGFHAEGEHIPKDQH